MSKPAAPPVSPSASSRQGRKSTNGKRYSLDFPPSVVREAVGLDAYEKAFLFMLASHKNLKSTRSREAVERSVGFKGKRIYQVRKTLVAKGLIRVFAGNVGRHTVYELDLNALQRWVDHPDAALAWERADKAARQGAARKPVRAHRLGEPGVRQLRKGGQTE